MATSTNLGTRTAEFISSLFSRKLLVAIISFLYFAINGDQTQAMAIVLAYFGANTVESIGTNR